jgi:hypothetical protein
MRLKHLMMPALAALMLAAPTVLAPVTAAEQAAKKTEAKATEKAGAKDALKKEKAAGKAVARQKGAQKVGAERAKVMEEAITALRETQKALAALQKKDKKAALAAIEKAIGKLEVILARDPKLALAPVDVATYTLDIYGSVDAVKKAVDTAVKMLKEGRVQDARALVSGLASEIVIEVVNIPLATYPDALKAIVPLIEAENYEAATQALVAALNTLVVTKHIIPLPVVRAEHLLALAEQLAEKKDRKAEENKKLEELLKAARTELEFAQALGYGKKEDFELFYKQLDEIEKKTGGGKHGKGFFDELKKALEEFRARLF